MKLANGTKIPDVVAYLLAEAEAVCRELGFDVKLVEASPLPGGRLPGASRVIRQRLVTDQTIELVVAGSIELGGRKEEGRGWTV